MYIHMYALLTSLHSNVIRPCQRLNGITGTLPREEAFFQTNWMGAKSKSRLSRISYHTLIKVLKKEFPFLRKHLSGLTVQVFDHVMHPPT